MVENKIILFDGVCNLCSSSVQFIIKNDDENIFKFASLQSEFGQKFLKENKLDSETFDSFILLDNNKVYKKSTAALIVAKHLKKRWIWLQVFWLIPTVLRDKLYGVISSNRYKWFGKKDECWLPTAELRGKFID